ncbi:MAG: dihydroorotase [Planctomycetota bacterium]|jgi:dihydroorotase
MRDLLVHGGRLVTPEGVSEGDVLIRDGSIAAVGPGLTAPGEATLVDATGRLVFPGLIDTQVHFREPGLEHKEDLASGSLAAVGGGVTTFFEMPNTKPPTVTPAALEDKLARARGRAWADHAFFMGATRENADQLGDWERLPGCSGIKIFMGSSTGSLLVDDDDTLERVLRSGEHRIPVHSEDEARLRARYADVPPGAPYRIHPEVRDVEAAVISTTRLLNMAEKTGRKIHLLHVSTAEELDLLRERDLGELVTAEATPNHLFLVAPECYDVFGSLVQMNPPVRDQRHRDALREAIADGTIDVIGSDHAPHTLEEKQRPYPDSPSGIPGVQTILPLLLVGVREGWIDLPRVARLTADGPARIYGIRNKGRLAPGCDGDVVLVDPSIGDPLPLEWLHSRAGYSPYLGLPLAGWPTTTILRGRVVYRDHAPVGEPDGRPAELA